MVKSMSSLFPGNSGGARMVHFDRVLRPIAIIALLTLCLPALTFAQTTTAPVAGDNSRDVDAANAAISGWWGDALKTRDQRLQWWRDARFGCFIHWGVYAIPAGEWNGKPTGAYSEHIMRQARIPLAVYKSE